MKLTYTIELQVDRDTGTPNVPKARVSAAILNDLIGTIGEAEYTVRNHQSGEDTTIHVKDVVIWPHEDSIPERMAMQPRNTVDRVPTTQPVDDPA